MSRVLAEGARYGRGSDGAGRQTIVEFVSANPTGPLHVGHGRHAAFGATVANLLEADGWRGAREYYVNDAGRQMDIIAASVWLRYLELCGEALPFRRTAIAAITCVPWPSGCARRRAMRCAARLPSCGTACRRMSRRAATRTITRTP